jgi:aspartate carbamoyltransferase catalytic subunit
VSVERRHLISIADLDRDDVERLLESAETFAAAGRDGTPGLPDLHGRTVVSVFFEPSTRTSSSFDLAARRLRAETLSLRASGSSVDKGESLRDTVQTLSAYAPDILVIRHAAAGAPAMAARWTDAHVVNAGDGRHQHPTQCLLDLYTIRAALGRLEGVHVAIVGDVLHSRVARSDIAGLRLMGAHVTLVGPPTLVPREAGALGVAVSHDIASIADADVIYVLRLQRERMDAGAAYIPSLREYADRWGVTPARVRPGQVVLHPGPINRGVEIAAETADADASRIVDQVAAGVAVRMAVLCDLVGGPGARDAEAALRIVGPDVVRAAGQEVA